MSDRDKILKKIVLYFIVPVVLVLVCALIYLLIKNHVCAKEDDLVQKQKPLLQQGKEQRAQEAQEKETQEKETQELLVKQRIQGAQKIDLELGQKRIQGAQKIDLEETLELERIAQEKKQRAQEKKQRAKEEERIAREKEQRAKEAQEKETQELLVKQRIQEKTQKIDLESEQKRIQGAQKIDLEETLELERRAQKKALKIAKIDEEFVKRLNPKRTVEVLLNDIKSLHEFLGISIDENTSNSSAKIQLRDGQETELYIEQCEMEQMQGSEEDIIGIMIAELEEKLKANINQHKLLFAFLEIMKTFNFIEFIAPNHTLRVLRGYYVGDFSVICNILCDNRHNYIAVYGTIQLSFMDVTFADALRNLRNVLEKICRDQYECFGDILEDVRNFCPSFFNRIPKLRNFSVDNKAVEEECTMVEIKDYSIDYYHPPDVHFYCVGGMNEAVHQWELTLQTSFYPEHVCRTFDSLVVLGKLHLNNSSKLCINKIAGAEKNLDYANKFVKIYDSIQKELTQKELTENEHAELILSKLKTIAQMDVPQMNLDLFYLPYKDYLPCKEYMKYRFINAQSFRSAIELACHVSNWTNWSDSIDSSQLYYFDTNFDCYSFDIDRCQKHIALLAKFMTGIQAANPTLSNDQALIDATEAVLRVKEILTALCTDPTKLAILISDLKYLEYLQYKLHEINEILCDIKGHDKIDATNRNRIIKMIIPILDPLEAFGVILPTWKEKKCIVLYKDGIAGDIYYKYYSISYGGLMEAVDIMQPKLNWCNARGDFDVNACSGQVQQIYALTKNVKFFQKINLPKENLPDGFIDIHHTFLYACRLLRHKNTCSKDRIYQCIVRCFSRSGNIKVRQLARQMFPPQLMDVNNQEKLRTVNEQSDRRTRWNDSNRLPFYSKLYVKNLNYIKRLSDVRLRSDEGVFFLAHPTLSFDKVPLWSLSTVTLWQRASDKVSFYDHFMGMHFGQVRPWSPFTVIPLERACDEIPFYDHFIGMHFEQVHPWSPSTVTLWQRASDKIPFYDHFTGMHFEQVHPCPFTVIPLERACDEIPFLNDFTECDSQKVQKNMSIIN